MTKFSALSTLALVVSSLVGGCAATEEDNVSGDTITQQQELTLSECSAQRDTCFSKNPLFGFFTCPAQYAQCTATASNGLPAEVGAAIADANACTKAAIDCAGGATAPLAAAVCAEKEAQCVAAIVDVTLPGIVQGTAGCVDSSVACIKAAKKASDLGACGQSYASCAVEQATAVIPPEVGKVVTGVNKCRLTLDSCIAGAETASDIAKCSGQGASCVAGTLNITLPNVPVSEVVHCAETASECAIKASSVRDVTACTTALAACNAEVVGSIDVPPQLSCQQKWTACMAKNPFDFLKCSANLTSCED
ncbi:MAG: hypothetical protein RL385_1415 [Pseudomonadota bacterium]|jgi:hypothetical protein